MGNHSNQEHTSPCDLFAPQLENDRLTMAEIPANTQQFSILTAP
jgi:hypothetical protein